MLVKRVTWLPLPRRNLSAAEHLFSLDSMDSVRLRQQHRTGSTTKLLSRAAGTCLKEESRQVPLCSVTASVNLKITMARISTMSHSEEVPAQWMGRRLMWSVRSEQRLREHYIEHVAVLGKHDLIEGYRELAYSDRALLVLVEIITRYKDQTVIKNHRMRDIRD